MFGPGFWWAVVGVALMICELMVPGLILFFFGLGALLTALLSWLIPMSLTVQLSIFCVASLVSLFTLRRMLKRVFVGRSSAVSGDALSESFAGEQGVVDEAVAPGKPGRVVLHGTAWNAESEEDLAVGTPVVVVGQRSLTLMVRAK